MNLFGHTSSFDFARLHLRVCFTGCAAAARAVLRAAPRVAKRFCFALLALSRELPASVRFRNVAFVSSVSKVSRSFRGSFKNVVLCR